MVSGSDVEELEHLESLLQSDALIKKTLSCVLGQKSVFVHHLPRPAE